MYNSRKDIAGVVTGLQAGKSRNCGLIAARARDFFLFSGNFVPPVGPRQHPIL